MKDLRSVELRASFISEFSVDIDEVPEQRSLLVLVLSYDGNKRCSNDDCRSDKTERIYIVRNLSNAVLVDTTTWRASYSLRW